MPKSSARSWLVAIHTFGGASDQLRDRFDHPACVYLPESQIYIRFCCAFECDARLAEAGCYSVSLRWTVISKRAKSAAVLIWKSLEEAALSSGYIALNTMHE